MTPFDPISPPADYPQSAKIITLHRRVPVRASADLQPPVGRRVSDPDEAYRDAILNEIGGYVGLAVMLLVAAAIGAMLALGSAF